MSRRTVHTIGGLLLCLASLCAAAHPALALRCSLSVSQVVFPSIDVTTGVADDTAGIVTMDCNGIPNNRPLRFCVGINGGTASDATSRIMTSGPTQELRFQLYTDAARTTPWGSWVPNLYGGGFQWDLPPDPKSVDTFTTPVYGRILPNQQTVSQGVYSSLLNAVAAYDSFPFLSCPFAGQGTTAASFNALVAVTNTCSVSASNLDFGTIGLLTRNVDATSEITAQCANGAPYTIGLDAGTGPGATVAVRKMSQGSNTLNYSLYHDPARTSVWGNTVGTDTAAGIGNGTVQDYTVYGRIPPQTIQGPGSYTDTIVVTLTF